MCQDYIYDKDIEQIAKEEQRKAWKLQGMQHEIDLASPQFYNAVQCCYSKQEQNTLFVCVCVFRHRGEVLNMGAYKEGAGAPAPQPQEEKNHLQLHHWSVSLTALRVRGDDRVAPRETLGSGPWLLSQPRGSFP